jgi:glycosyltransferase involved in cell wall biosynthesis
VLQAVLTLNPGGTERLVVDIVRRLHAEIPMAVCCLDEEGAWADSLRAEGIKVTALRRQSGFHPSLGSAVAATAKWNHANVIHCHHYSPFVYGSLARAWRPSTKVIFTEHGRLSDAPPSTKRMVANWMLRRAPQEVFAVSEHLKGHLVAEGFSREQVQVLYNGIDVGPLPDTRARSCIRQRLAVSDDTLVVGTIARLDPVKDLDTMIRAITMLAPRRPILLVVIGDGDERSRLEELTARLGAGTAVRFLGHREDARTWLAGCDVYANSSIHEGVSLTILEAMAAGLPTVATGVGGTPEIIDNTCGRLVPSRDAATLASALDELAQREILRQKLGHSARRRVEERFTIERMVQEYRAAYYRAAGQSDHS